MASEEHEPDGVVTGNEVQVVSGRTTVAMRGSHEVEHAAARRFIQEAQAQTVDDDQVASLAIIDHILNADSIDDALAPPETTSSTEIVDVPFSLLDVRWMKSDKEAGAGFYGMLTVKFLSNGDPGLVTCGAASVMAFAFHAKDKGWLPCDVVIKRSPKPTARGFYPLHLEKAPTPFE